MAFKLIEAAQDHWRSVNGVHLVALDPLAPRSGRRCGRARDKDSEVAA
jgi:hypothetical protein